MVIGLLSALVVLVTPAFASSRAASPQEVVQAVGARQGICVVVGEGACDLALELAKGTELLIYTQLQSKDFESACRRVEEAGYYGSRIFVGEDAQKLHLAGNVADVVVALGNTPGFSTEEMLRVARPAGKVILSDKTVTKPFPQGVDDWTHPYHGPDNNPQSNDKVILAPYLTQFMAEPRYAPLPQVCVSSAGRMFKAFGHVAWKEREEPYLNKLIAFNGYNGSILWQRDLTEGVMIHRNTMIATPTKLYIGDDKSCKVIDTATGKLLDEIIPPVEAAGGTFWKWMALENGVLYAMMGEQEQRDPTKRWKRDTARLALGPDLGGLEPAREPLGLRPPRPGHRPRDEEGPLEPPRAGPDRRPGHLHEGRPDLRLSLRGLPGLPGRQDRQ